MKKYIIVFLTLLYGGALLADEPGKPVNHDCRISFQGITRFPQWKFYWRSQFGSDTAQFLKADGSVTLFGSQGRPDQGFFWGVQDKTGVHTDTIFFENYHAPDYLVILDTLYGNKLNTHRIELSNENRKIALKDTTGIINKNLVADAKKFEEGHKTRIWMLSGLSLLALGILVWLFLRRKKPDSNA